MENVAFIMLNKNSRLRVSDMCDRANLAKSYISNQYVKPYAVFNEQMSKVTIRRAAC